MDKFQKIVNLIKKTGDKAIILDQNGDPNCVVMNLEDYEKLILGKSEVRGLTETELLDKINRDIAIWKEDQGEEASSIDQQDFSKNVSNYSSFDEAFDADLNDLNREPAVNEEEDRYYFEAVE
ncbi:MAG: hypothetical protein WCV92_04830 [Candidatus Buchananbacteria bacterium]